jgi:diacylglycerol kinase
MEITHPEIALQAPSSALRNTGSAIKKIFAADPAMAAQLCLTIPIIATGIALQMNALQWILVAFVTILFLMAGIFRTAALLQTRHDKSLTPFHVNRIRCMGNAIVTLTAGLSLITYLLIFVPLILVRIP